MHEAQLVEDALETLASLVGGEEVREIEIALGPGVDPSLAARAWGRLAAGTSFATTHVTWEEALDVLRCGQCGQESPANGTPVCVRCGGEMVLLPAEPMTIGRWVAEPTSGSESSAAPASRHGMRADIGSRAGASLPSVGMLDEMWEEPGPEPEAEFSFDLEGDMVSLREDIETDHEGETPPVLADEPMGEESSPTIASTELDSVVDELVELLNARDLESLVDILAPDVGSDFLREVSCEGVIQGLDDVLLRNPSLVVTRGHFDIHPIVAIWLFDGDESRYRSCGYLVCDADDGLIRRLEYLDELPDSEDLVVERPEDVEIAEWDDWSSYDES